MVARSYGDRSDVCNKGPNRCLYGRMHVYGIIVQGHPIANSRAVVGYPKIVCLSSPSRCRLMKSMERGTDTSDCEAYSAAPPVRPTLPVRGDGLRMRRALTASRAVSTR